MGQATPKHLQMSLIEIPQTMLRNSKNFPSHTGITGNQGFLSDITLIRNAAWILPLILHGTACPKGGHAAEKQGPVSACFSIL